ncbi:hypothetical protein GCM10010388_30770 [Streptomyces mauvecolor]
MPGRALFRPGSGRVLDALPQAGLGGRPQPAGNKHFGIGEVGSQPPAEFKGIPLEVVRWAVMETRPVRVVATPFAYSAEWRRL